MAVIDLDQGTVDRSNDQPQPGRIIDLDTGTFVSLEDPERLERARISKERKESVLEASRRDPTRAELELPEITNSGLLSEVPMTEVAKVSPAILTATDPREIGNILSNTFPQIGITEDENGNLIANNNDTGVQAVINKPGMSPIDVLQAIGIGSLFTPSAGLAGTVTGTVPKAIVGATGAGLTQGVVEGVQQASGGEFNEEEMALATGLGFTAELAMPFIQGLRTARRSKKVGATNEELQDSLPSIREADNAVNQVERLTGEKVGLFPAQRTQIPSQLQKQRLLPQLDAGSRIALRKLEKQNEEAFNATLKFIDTVVPGDASKAPTKLRSTAKMAIDAQKAVRKESAKFGRAIDISDEQRLGEVIDLNPVNERITSLLDESVTGGELEKTIARVKGFLTPKEGQGFLTFKQLQRAKKEMDGIINKIGPDAIDPSVKGEVVKLKNQLVEQMKKTSPAFKEASERFAQESIAVSELQDGLIGRIATVSDKQLRNISSEIFNPRTSPGDVRRVRDVIEGVDPQAWQDIVRNEVDFRVGSLTAQIEEAGSDIIPNIPAALKRNLFGAGRQRETLLRSLTGEQRKNFVYMERVLGRASEGRAAGSPTASFTEILKDLRGKLGILKDVFTRPIESIQTAGDTSLFNRKVKALTQILYDPKWTPRMAELRRLGTESPAAARAMVQLIDDTLADDPENLQEQ